MSDEDVTPAQALAQSRESRAKTDELADSVMRDVSVTRGVRIKNNWANKLRAEWQASQERKSA